MASPDQGVVAKVRKGLRVGSPKGTGSEVAMEGRRSRGGVRVSGEHKGRQPGVGGDGEKGDREGDEVPGQESEEDRPGPP